MAYTFVNTITLPWHYLRFTFISDAATGSSSATNGGYIESCGELEASLDSLSGDVRFPSISMTLLNTGNLWSTSIFPSATAVRMKIEVSFNAGSTYSDVFIGKAELEQLEYTDNDATETRNRVYSVKFNSCLTTLKDVLPIISNAMPYFTPITDSRTTIQVEHTDETGTPMTFQGYAQYSARFLPISSLFAYIAGSIDWGVFAPTVSVDYSLLEMLAKNDNTGLGYTFADWYLWCGANSYSNFDSHSYFSSSYGVQDCASVFELLQRLCQSLAIVPIEVYGSGTYTLLLVPRFPTSPTAITGPLEFIISRNWKNAPWATGGRVTTVGLPIYNDRGGKEKAINIRNLWQTGVQFTSGYDFYLWGRVFREGMDGKFVQDDTSAAFQVFVKTAANTFRHAHRVKFYTAQTYYETGAPNGYYGFQLAVYNYLIGAAGFFDGAREGYSNEYNGVKGATMTDVRLLKSVSTNTIEGIAINLFQNGIKLQLAKTP